MTQMRYTARQRIDGNMSCTIVALGHYARALTLAAFMLAIGSILSVGAYAQTPPAGAAPAQTSPVQTTPAPVTAETPASGSTVPPAAESAARDTTMPSTVSPLAAPPAAPDVALKLPRDLSPWGMFMAADIVVKAVMVGLAFASVLSWTIWFAKAIELMFARRRMRRAIAALDAARSWSDAAHLQDERGSAATLIRAADTELSLSAGDMSPNGMSPEGVKERVASRLERAEAAASRAMVRGTGILATIGATAPFVGLFGTVWGIMNSFIGISKAQTTNLAVVAPGIAEALLATALGLVAAIPAVVMYNFFSRWISGYRAQHADASAAILRIIGRDFDRGAFDAPRVDRHRSAAAAE